MAPRSASVAVAAARGEGRDGRLQRGHDPQPVGLAERHEPHGDGDLPVHGGREVGEQRIVEIDLMRGGDGADGDRVGAGVGAGGRGFPPARPCVGGDESVAGDAGFA